MSEPDRIEMLADAYRENVVLMFDYKKHIWVTWIA